MTEEELFTENDKHNNKIKENTMIKFKEHDGLTLTEEAQKEVQEWKTKPIPQTTLAVQATP